MTVLAFVAWLALAKRKASVDLQTEVARIHAAGEPLTSDDMYGFHAVPDETSDITAHWQTALESFDERQFNADGKPLPIVGEGPEDMLRGNGNDQGGDIIEFLQKYEHTIQATLQAAQAQGQCRFPVRFEAGFTAFLQHAQKLRVLARLFLLRSQWQSRRGDVEGWLQSVDAIFAVSRSLAHQPSLVEHLVRLATFGVALNEVQRVINETQRNDDQLARLQEWIETSNIKSGLTTALFGDRAMNFLAFHNLQSLSRSGVRDNQEIVLALDSDTTRPGDCLLSLELFGEAINASREPFPSALRRIEQVENRLKSLLQSNYLQKFKYTITLLLFPATRAAFEAEGRNLAGRYALLVAIASERHRLKTGSFPAQLDDIVPEFLPAVPTDPFDGKPLRKISAENSMTIYSVGRDGKDDGGSQVKPSGEPDIVVELRAKKQSEN